VTEEQIELLAIRAARGDDIAKWPPRYCKDQKSYWRKFVLDIAALVGEAEFRRGYDKARAEYQEQEMARARRARRSLLG